MDANAMKVPREDAYKGKGWIRTQNGYFVLEEPTFDIQDIAHALAQVNRFNGHTDYPYSVAAHSLNVSRIMEILGAPNPQEGLLHDATEAYLSDVPAPFKQFLPDWSRIDGKLEMQMRERFALGGKTELCKQADWVALFIEAWHLLPGQGEDFSDPNGMRALALELLDEHPELAPGEYDWREVRLDFLDRCDYYDIS